MTFNDKLRKITLKNNSLLCIGLDSELAKIPQHLKERGHPQHEFNQAIIKITHDLVCAYKLNTAFYEARGENGIRELKRTCDYLKESFPEIPVIVDAKRADIGNSNEGYTKFIFDYLSADAVTVHPYLGQEALKPFLDRLEKGIFVLCRSSNPGAGEFQDLEVNGKPLYQVVAENVADKWNYNNNCGVVVGATYPSELEIVRRIVDKIPILIPGIVTQGGDIEKTVKSGVDSEGLNAIINSSRGIIFAGDGPDFTDKARSETIKLRDEINKYR